MTWVTHRPWFLVRRHSSQQLGLGSCCHILNPVLLSDLNTHTSAHTHTHTHTHTHKTPRTHRHPHPHTHTHSHVHAHIHTPASTFLARRGEGMVCHLSKQSFPLPRPSSLTHTHTHTTTHTHL